MFTCKDCVHGDVCVWIDKEVVYNLKGRTLEQIKTDLQPKCKHFKNKADFVEVKHGEWLPDYETFVDEWERESEPVQTGWVCSLCGRQEWNKEPYCHCGADMRKGGADNG
jgi:hypothetical protein